MDEINANGEVSLKFQPPIVAVPNDWKRLFDLKEREKMAPVDRKVFEEELLSIMHVEFEQHSDERP